MSVRTIDSYTYHVDRFAKHFGRQPEDMGPEQIREFQLWMIQVNKSSWIEFPGASHIAIEWKEDFRTHFRWMAPCDGPVPHLCSQENLSIAVDSEPFEFSPTGFNNLAQGIAQRRPGYAHDAVNCPEGAERASDGCSSILLRPFRATLG